MMKILRLRRATGVYIAVLLVCLLSPSVAAFVTTSSSSSMSSSGASYQFRFRSRRTSTVQSSSDSSSSNKVVEETSSSEFRWETEWYPVSPLQDLDRHRPNKITLLGKDFVVWYNEPDSTWTAFADSCPHRLVPLSEGRIETKNNDNDNDKSSSSQQQFLQCAYHGWEFDIDGKCRLIPQLSTTSCASAIKNPRSCATSFPVQVAQDLLWLFPTAHQPALAASKSLPLIPELDDPDMIDGTNFFVRDMPYSWDVLVENLCDPAHVPFAHHSFMRGANRNTNRDNLQLNLVMTQQTSSGFQATKDPRPTPPGQYDFTFTAPCLLYSRIANSQALVTTTSTSKRNKGDDTNTHTNTRADNVKLLKRGNFIGLGQYCIPTAPGKSRLIARFPLRIPFPPAMWLMKHTPRWVNHFSQNIVMDSDVVFLCSQDEALDHPSRSSSNNSSSSSNSRNKANYFLPGRSDVLVWAFRKWLATSGGGQPQWLGIPASRSSGDAVSWLRPMSPSLASRRDGRDALLDRYRQHTEICSSCKKAHQVLYKIRTVLQYTGVAGLILLASTASSASTSMGTSMAMTTLNKVLYRKRIILGIFSAMALLIPRVVLRPIIARMECVPWPRKRWLFDSST